MAKGPIIVTVRATVSFNGIVKGDTGEVDLTERVEGLIKGGYLEVISDGETEVGPGGPAAGDPGSESERAGEDRAPRGEQGEDPLPG